MSFFFDLITYLLAFLPNSFVIAALDTFSNRLSPFFNVIGYINWFLPFGLLVRITAGWVVGLLTTVIIIKLLKL